MYEVDIVYIQIGWIKYSDISKFLLDTSQNRHKFSRSVSSICCSTFQKRLCNTPFNKNFNKMINEKENFFKSVRIKKVN